MNPRSLCDLKPADEDGMIEARICRNWLFFYPSDKKPKNYNYLLVDKEGNAIQASMSFANREHFDNVAKVGKTYRITNFICIQAWKTNKIVPHNTMLEFGLITRFEAINGAKFPINKFNFIQYEDLAPRIKNDVLLKDYLGMLSEVSDIKISQDEKGMKKRRELQITNLSNQKIQLTLWAEFADSFEKEHFSNMAPLVIIAITSTRVGLYRGDVQLIGTSATRWYLNPDIQEARNFIARLATTTVTPTQEKSSYICTVAEILHQNPDGLMAQKFICNALIKTIDASKGWFYKACTTCQQQLRPVGHRFICKNHGEPNPEPRPLYKFRATIADHTAIAEVIFFNNVAQQLLNISCVDMMKKYGFTDPDTLPDPLKLLLQEEKKLQLSYGELYSGQHPDIIVSGIILDSSSELPHEESSGKQTESPTGIALMKPLTPTPHQLIPQSSITEQSEKSTIKGITQVQRRLFSSTDEHEPTTPSVIKKSKKDDPSA